ncbi:MAG: protein kinase [Verrucomicrobia bacterium]|nr:protein kinase [Verrucomicrobiota bacterium]
MKTCTECGGLISRDAGLGLCPACLLSAALQVDGDAYGGSTTGESSRTADYEILEEVARGGMGVVYRARQRSLNRTVALKVLLGGLFAGEEGRRRMKCEATLAARLQHPNIVPVYDTGSLDGQPFYSMAFVEGRTLAEVVQHGPLAPNRSARYLARIAEAVHYAHGVGVLHRDLKPSNVLIDAADEPHVTDFGLAKALDAAPQTLTGGVLGSPAYMPPEQALGRTSDVTARSDVYSLGAILYELLTGRPPFQGTNLAAVIAQVKDVDPVAPRRLNAGIPADLETICLKCLEKQPARRYVSAGELAADLQRYLQGEPVHARPISAAGRAWRWAHRRPLAATLIGVSVLMLLLSAAVLVVSSVRIRESRDVAQARLADALFSEARALRAANSPGWRAQALQNLVEVRRLDGAGRLTDSLRREAIAALARPDLLRHIVTNLPPVADEMLVCFDREFERVALWQESEASIAVYRVDNQAQLVSWFLPKPDELRAFSADGRYLLVRHGGVMSVWNAATGAEVLSGAGSESHRKFNGAAFSPDGKRLCRGETNGWVRIYDLTPASPRRVSEWRTPEQLPVTTVAWAPNGDAVALTLEEFTVAVCDVATGRVRWSRQFPAQIWNVTWDNPLDWLVLQTGEDRVLALAAATGQEVHRYNQITDGRTMSLIDPRGEMLVSSRLSYGTKFFDPHTGAKLIGDKSSAWHLHFDAAGRRLGSLLENRQPLWLEYAPPPIRRELHSPGDPFIYQRLEFSPDGRWLASLNANEVLLWDAISWQVRARLALPRAELGPFDATGQHLLVVQSNQLCRVAVADSGFGVPELLFAAGKLASPALSGDGTIAVPDLTENVVWLRRGSAWVKLPIQMFPVMPVFSPDGRWLACPAYAGDRLLIFDTHQPEAAPQSLPGSRGRPKVSPDGKWLVTLDREAHVRRVGDWQPVMNFPEEIIARSMRAEFSPDGQWLAIVQRGGIVQLLEPKTGKRIAVLEGPDGGRFFDIAFHPDGKSILLAQDHGVIQVWKLPELRAELAKLGLDW